MPQKFGLTDGGIRQLITEGLVQGQKQPRAAGVTVSQVVNDIFDRAFREWLNHNELLDLRPAVVCPQCAQGELDRGANRGRCPHCDCYFAVPPEGLTQAEWEALPKREQWSTSRQGLLLEVVPVMLVKPERA